jgi:hypothetical protein
LRFRPGGCGDLRAKIVLGRHGDRHPRELAGRGTDETAGVDDDEIGAGVGRSDRIAFGAQLREDEPTHVAADQLRPIGRFESGRSASAFC